MQGAVIRMGGDAGFAGAIAEGMVKAENEALKGTIEMLLCEIAQKNELIEMYRWKEQRSMEQALMRHQQAKKKTRVPMWQRICRALGLI